MRETTTETRDLQLIDGHAHLDELKELQKNIHEAQRAGVSAIIGVGMDSGSNERILAIAREHPGFIYPAIGYHPWKINKAEIHENITCLEKNIHQCVAIGEVGLDYKARVKKEFQKDVFREILKLSAQFHKPLILHCRYSHERVFSMVSEREIERAVFHWYTGSLNLLRNIIDAGYFISATPALSYSAPLQEAVKEAPIERILLETDSPVTYQGHVSRPADVRITLNEVARIKGLSLKEVANQTSRNALELFRPLNGKSSPPPGEQDEP